VDDGDHILIGNSADDGAESPTDNDQPVSVRSRVETDGAESPSTFCPIVSERPVGSLDMLRGLSPAGPRTAVVVVTARGAYVPYVINLPTKADLVRKRARFVSEVDLRWHSTRIRCALPSALDIFHFSAVVDLYWHVCDPVQVVKDGLRDVRSALEPPILARLRLLTRRYTEEQSADAETKLNAALRDLPEADQLGLEMTAFVQLGMDDAVRDQLRLEVRVAAYRDIIAAGDLNQVALRLAQDPQDAAAVVQLLIEERDRHRHDLVDFVTRLIDSGAIERHQIDDQVRAVLQWLREDSNHVITGKDEIRHASLGKDGHRLQEATTGNGRPL
jgi:hypothetical protein